MYKRVISVVAALFAVLAIATAVPANAEPGPNASAAAQISPIVTDSISPQARECASGDLCFWVNAGYSGARGRVSGNNPNWTDFAQSSCRNGTWSDCASSVWNNGQRCDVQLWSQPNYVDQVRTVRRGASFDDLRSIYFNDATTSNKWVNCTS